MNPVAAVTVHFGKPEFTTRLLDQLSDCYSISRVVVVLHSPFDSKTDRVRTARTVAAAAGAAQGTLLEDPIFLEQENRGYAAGLNLALRHLQKLRAQETAALILNPDVNINPQQIETLIRLHHLAEADATFPAIRESKLLIHGYRMTKWGTLRAVQAGADFYPATCFLLSLDAWEKTGGFDEAYFHYFEDFDFCDRLKRAGCTIHPVSEVVITHEGKSGAHFPGTILPRYAVRNHLLFLQKRRQLDLLSFWNVILRHFLYLFRWKAGWRGIAEWHRGIREFLSRN